MSFKTVLASFSLIGTIIGAGIFAIPYVIIQSGLAPVIFYFILLTLVVLTTHLLFGEIVLRTKGKHRLVGYAQKYLGQKAKHILGVVVLINTIGSLLVYLILSGEFLKLISADLFGGANGVLIAWALYSVLIFFGLKAVSFSEFAMDLAMFIIGFLIIGLCLPHIGLANAPLSVPRNLFLPFGIILFSLTGMSAIPEAANILGGKKGLKLAIISAILVCSLFTLLFGLAVALTSGQNTTQEGLVGLKPILGDNILIFGGIFGFLSVATSFLIIGHYLKNTFELDYGFNKLAAFLVVCFAPLVLFLAGLRHFVAVIAILGAFSGTIEGIAVVFIYLKAKKNGDQQPSYNLRIPKIILGFIIAILCLGALLQIIYGN